MELHHQLLTMAQQRGPAIIEQPGQLRAALEDHLDEAAASTGDLNLLTDAVRLGGVNLLRSTLQGGATVPAAVEAAGDYLARQRGSTDVASCRWAVAAIGYALGVVPDEVASAMRRQYEGGASPAGPAVTTSGWQPPVVSPLPPTMSPGQAAGHPPAQSPMHAHGPAQPYAAPQQWGPPQPARRSKVPLVAVASAVGAVLLGAGIAWAVTSGGDDDKKKDVADEPTAAVTTDPSGSPSPSGTAAGSGTPLEDMTPEEVRDAVMATMESVTSLNMSGHIDQEDMTLDLSMDTDGRCKGTMEVEGGEASIISDGSGSYMRGNEDFWVASTGEDASSLSMFIDTWVKMQTGDDSFDSFCDLDNLLEEFTGGGSADFEVGGTRIVNGNEAVELVAKDGSRLMVANSAPHHILKIISRDPLDSGEFTFSRYNEQLEISPPDDYLDLDSFG